MSRKASEPVEIVIVSKPLQYFNSRNIRFSNKPLRKILIVQGTFLNSKEFMLKIKKYDPLWQDVVWVKGALSLASALRQYDIFNLYIYLDCYLVNSVILDILKFRNLWVYEEGFGSYRKNIFSHLPWYKRMVRGALGVPDFSGGHAKTTGVILYNPEYYKSNFNYAKQVVSFKRTFSDMLSESSKLIECVYDDFDFRYFQGLKNKLIGFYISSWKVEQSELERVVNANNFDLFIIKPHPHIKDMMVFNLMNVYTITSTILVEFVVSLLLKNSNRIHLYHENSSSALYLKGFANLRMINIGRHNDEFEKMSISNTV